MASVSRQLIIGTPLLFPMTLGDTDSQPCVDSTDIDATGGQAITMTNEIVYKKCGEGEPLESYCV